MECHYCEKSCEREAFIPETNMTIDFPICDNKCLKKLRLERGYDKPKLKWEKEFVLKLLKEEKSEFVKRINERIREIKSKL